MKTIYVVMSIARQINGEFFLTRSEKAFVDMNKAEKLKEKLDKECVNADGKSNSFIYKIENNQEINCNKTIAIFEVLLDE